MPKKTKIDYATREMTKMRRRILKLHKKGVLGKIAQDAMHEANAKSGPEPPGWTPELPEHYYR